MKKIAEGIQDFKELERIIFNTMCEVGRELLEECLKICDQQVLAFRDTKKYRFINFSTTTIKTLMGEVTYTRRRYKKQGGGYTFLLDKAIGVTNGYGLVSENLADQIIIESTDKSFRKAAKSISSLTGQGISAMGAWGVLQRFGEKLEAQKERLGELDREGTVGQLGNLSSRVLFGELDDVWIPMQKEKRREKGSPKKADGKRAGKKPIHVGTAYTGWEEAEDGKFRTLDKFAYAGFGASDKFTSDFEMLLRHRFDMDGVERRVTNGDGASWIKSAVEESDAVLQLDPFHRSRAVMRAVADKNDQRALFDALNEKDVDKAITIITGLTNNATDESSREKLQKLYGYFYSNKDSLLTWQERGLKLPEPPEGVVYRNLGVQESSNCDLITQRMKHRKGSWSAVGGEHMAKTLCFLNTIGVDTMLGMLPEPVGTTIPGTLSAAKAPINDGKGYDAAWLHADMPFEDMFKTNGREAVRGLLRLKPLSSLSFK